MAFAGIDWERLNVDVGRMGEHAREASELLKALAHEGRLLILCDLLHGEKSVGELEALLSRRQASVSQQLARLRLEGLLSTRRDGRTIYYATANQRQLSLVGALYPSFCGPDNHHADRAKTRRAWPSSIGAPGGSDLATFGLPGLPDQAEG